MNKAPIINQVQTYRIFDDPSHPDFVPGAIRINRNEAKAWNEKGWGIFHTVQGFWGARKKDNLVNFNSWYVECDALSKKEQWELIKKSPLRPTMIIESKRSFHIYFAILNATKEEVLATWKAIMEFRLIPFFKGDKKAKDITRLLRTPGFNHMKDPTDPFLVKKIYEGAHAYTIQTMLSAFEDKGLKKRQRAKELRAMREAPMTGSFWDNVSTLDCELALTKLSGTDAVLGEIYTFRNNSQDSLQILVNNRASSCWIDRDKKIGSYDGGGPTVAQWLNYFHGDYKKVVEILKTYFPELEKPTEPIQGSLL